jgi:hypothetical protein
MEKNNGQICSWEYNYVAQYIYGLNMAHVGMKLIYGSIRCGDEI